MRIKRKLHLNIVNIRLLPHNIPQETEYINMISAENLSYPSTE